MYVMEIILTGLGISSKNHAHGRHSGLMGGGSCVCNVCGCCACHSKGRITFGSFCSVQSLL